MHIGGKRYLIGFFLMAGFLEASSKRFVILTASYNNQEWYERNLASIFAQDHADWRLVYIDDFSPDGTGDAVEQYILQHGYLVDRFPSAHGLSEIVELRYVKENSHEHHVTLVKNKVRRKHLANQYEVTHNCDPDEIIVICDGDDWFAHDHVLSYLNNVYQNPDVWLTYGQFWYWQKDRLGCSREVPYEVLKEGRIREHRPWVTSHLRTYYAGLCQLICYEDLLYQGEFFQMCADVAQMMPMIDMAGERAHFIKDILYIYNDANCLCFYHDHKDEQRAIESEIRDRPRYQRLEHAIFLKT